MLDFVILAQFARRPFQRDLSGFHDIALLRQGQREAGVLLDQHDGAARLVQATDNLGDLAAQDR